MSPRSSEISRLDSKYTVEKDLKRGKVNFQVFKAYSIIWADLQEVAHQERNISDTFCNSAIGVTKVLTVWSRYTRKELRNWFKISWMKWQQKIAVALTSI